MPAFGPIERKELLRALKKAGFEGPYPAGKHEFPVKGNLRLTLPDLPAGEISNDLLARILRQTDILREEWEKL